MGQLDSKLDYVNATYLLHLKWITVRNYVNTFSLHCQQGQEMFQAQMDNMFGGEMVGEIPMFFLREKKQT